VVVSPNYDRETQPLMGTTEEYIKETHTSLHATKHEMTK